MDDYPRIDVDELEILLLKIREEGARYLMDEECPYPARLVDLLLEYRGTGGEVEDEDEGDLDLVKENQRILRELKDQKDTLKDDDHSEAMAYYRTSTAVLEKLVSMQERANNVRQIGKFYGIVMETMEEFLDAAQITELRERLKEFGV